MAHNTQHACTSKRSYWPSLAHGLTICWHASFPEEHISYCQHCQRQSGKQTKRDCHKHYQTSASSKQDSASLPCRAHTPVRSLSLQDDMKAYSQGMATGALSTQRKLVARGCCRQCYRCHAGPSKVFSIKTLNMSPDRSMLDLDVSMIVSEY